MKKNLIISIFLMIVGILLRLNAQSIAWPERFHYSGPRENTNWAIMEKAISDVSIFFMCVGGLVFIGALITSQITKNSEKNAIEPRVFDE